MSNNIFSKFWKRFMSKPSSYILKKVQLSHGIKLCSENIQNLLEVATQLAKDNPVYAYALFLFALEETGKKLLLLDILQNKHDSEEYEVSISIFRDHGLKFRRAFNIFPEKTIPVPSIKVIKNNSGVGTTVAVGGKNPPMINVEGGTTGIIETPLQGSIDNILRSRVFLIDWNDDIKKWMAPRYAEDELDHVYYLDQSKLESAINNLKKIDENS